MPVIVSLPVGSPCILVYSVLSSDGALNLSVHPGICMAGCSHFG